MLTIDSSLLPHFWNCIPAHQYHAGDVDPEVSFPCLEIDRCSITHSTPHAHCQQLSDSESQKKIISKLLPMLTKMCTAPKSSTVLATAFLQDSSLLTSAWMISETPPSSSIIRFVSLAQSTLKSIRATLAPCLARRMAAARPFPISPVHSQPKRTLKQGSTLHY